MQGAGVESAVEDECEDAEEGALETEPSLLDCQYCLIDPTPEEFRELCHRLVGEGMIGLGKAGSCLDRLINVRPFNRIHYAPEWCVSHPAP